MSLQIYIDTALLWFKKGHKTAVQLYNRHYQQMLCCLKVQQNKLAKPKQITGNTNYPGFISLFLCYSIVYLLMCIILSSDAVA